MSNSKDDLNYYLLCDRIALRIPKRNLTKATEIASQGTD